MGKLFAVIEREFMERVRSKWFVLTTLFGPFLFAGLTIGPPILAFRSARAVDVSRMVIVDATQVGAGNGIATELAGGLSSAATPPTVIAVNAGTRATVVDSLRALLATDRIPAAVIVDDSSMTTGAVRVLLAGGAPLATSERVQRAAERELLRRQIATTGIDVALAERITRFSVSAKVERVLRDGRSGSAQVNIIFGAGVAVLLYIVIVLYGQIVLRGVTEEKQSRVSELVLASVPPRVLLSGKVLGIGGVALLQLGFWTSSLLVLMANRERLLAAFGVAGGSMALPTIGAAELVPLFAYFTLGYVLYAALFAAVGSIVSSEQEAQQAQTPVIMLLVGSMALLQPALADPDGPIARAMSIIPFSSPILMPLRLGLVSVPAADLAMSLSLLSLTAVGAMIAAGRLYRTAMLMYGKRPSLAEVFRWIRNAD